MKTLNKHLVPDNLVFISIASDAQGAAKIIAEEISDRLERLGYSVSLTVGGHHEFSSKETHLPPVSIKTGLLNEHIKYGW